MVISNQYLLFGALDNLIGISAVFLLKCLHIECPVANTVGIGVRNNDAVPVEDVHLHTVADQLLKCAEQCFIPRGKHNHSDNLAILSIYGLAVRQTISRNIIHIPEAQIPAGIGLTAVMLDVPVGVFQAFQIVFIRVSRKHTAVVHQNIDRHIHADPFELTVGLLQQHLDGTAALFTFRRRQIIVKILIQCIHRLHHVGAVDRVAVADLLQYIYAGLAFFAYYKLKGKISDRADRNRYRNQHAQQTGRYHALRHFAAFASA